MAKASKKQRLTKEYKAFCKKVGKKIYTLRIKKNLTQQDMEAFGISRRTFIRCEKAGPQKLRYLFKIAKALKIKPHRLIKV